MTYQIPEWMRQLSQAAALETQAQQRLASNNTTDLPVDPLWSEKQVECERLVAHVKEIQANASASAVQANALRLLSSAMRGTNYKVANTEFKEGHLLVHAHVYSPNRKQHVPATFIFSWDQSFTPKLANTFSSNGGVYPLSGAGVRMAFTNSQENPHTTKIITRAQLASRLEVKDLRELDTKIKNLVDDGTLTYLNGNQFAYTTLARRTASLPLDMEKEDKNQELNQDSDKKPAVEEKSKMSENKPEEKKPLNSVPQPPTPPLNQGRLASTHLSRVFAGFDYMNESCGEMMMDEACHDVMMGDQSLSQPQCCPTCGQPCDEVEMSCVNQQCTEFPGLQPMKKVIEFDAHSTPISGVVEFGTVASVIRSIKHAKGGGRDYSKNCKSCGTMYSGSNEAKTEARKTCPKCGGELGGPNWK